MYILIRCVVKPTKGYRDWERKKKLVLFVPNPKSLGGILDSKTRIRMRLGPKSQECV